MSYLFKIIPRYVVPPLPPYCVMGVMSNNICRIQAELFRSSPPPELQNFKVLMGPRGYKLIDVRRWTNFLSFTSSLRTLKGTADAVLVPYATFEHTSAVLQLRSVIVW